MVVYSLIFLFSSTTSFSILNPPYHLRLSLPPPSSSLVLLRHPPERHWSPRVRQVRGFIYLENSDLEALSIMMAQRRRLKSLMSYSVPCSPQEDYQTNVDDDETSLVISNAAPRTPSYAQNPSAHTTTSVAPRQNGDLTRSPSFVAQSGSPEGSPTARASPLPALEPVASPQESLIAPPTNPEVCSLTSSIYDALPYDALPCEAQPLLLQRDGCVADDQISVFSHQSDYSQGHARQPSANTHSRQPRSNHAPATPPVPELCSPEPAEGAATPSDPAPSPPRLFASPTADQEATSHAPAPVTSSQTPNPESPTLAPPGAAPSPPLDAPLPAPQAPQRHPEFPATAHHSPVLTSAHLTPVPASSHHILAASHPSHMPASSHHTHAPAVPFHTHVPAPHHCHAPTSAHLAPVSPPAHYTHVMAPPPYSPAPSPPTSYLIPAHHAPLPAPHYSVSASASSPVSIPPPPYQFAAPAPVAVAVLNPQQRAPAPWHHAPALPQPTMSCPYHHAQKQQQQPGQDAAQYQGTMPPEQHARSKNQHDAWCALAPVLPGGFAAESSPAIHLGDRGGGEREIDREK